MMKKDKNNFKNFNLLPFLILIFLAVIVSGCITEGAVTAPNGNTPSAGTDNGAFEPPQNPDLEQDTDKMENKTGVDNTDDAIALAIADGTYTDEVSYQYHSGTETFEAKVTVENDVITEASITPKGEPHEVSLGKMEAVNGALPDLVIGKKITELNIPKNVAGSSLTTAAFKNYLEQLVENN